MSFLDYKHPHYKRKAHEWIFAHDHLSAAILDELMSAGLGTIEEIFLQQDPGSSNASVAIGSYLQKRLQGESDEAYRERQGIADYTPLYPHGVITLSGLAWSNAEDTTTTFSESDLGDPKDEETIAGMLQRDFDGKGTDRDVVLKLATTDIIATKEIWMLVEGVKRDEQGVAMNKGSVRFFLPQDVIDWTEDDTGMLDAVKVRYRKDTRKDITEKPEEIDIYQVFRKDGWVKYAKGKDGKEKEIARSTYGGDRNESFRYYTTSDPNTWHERLPIRRYELPIRVNLGYVMARKANAIYNMESARDFQLWAACFPKAMLDVLNEDKSLNEPLYNELRKVIDNGDNAWPGAGHEFKTPPVEGAEIRNATLEMKAKQFMKTFFQLAADQAVERTAAEIKVDFKTGVAAFLGGVVTTLDEMENDAWFLLEQVNFPGERGKWGKTKVKRSQDFSHIDVDAEIDRAIMRWAPGGTLPAPEEIVLQLFHRAAERDKFDVSEIEDDSLRALIRQAMDQGAQAGDVFSQLRRRRLSNGETQ